MNKLAGSLSVQANTTLNKAVELEKQMINISLYDPRALLFLTEIDSDDFIIEYHRKIKDLITMMVANSKAISPTSVHNEILDKDLQDRFVDLAIKQYVGNHITLYEQFKKFHRMVRLQPHIEELFYMSCSGNINFDDKFDELSNLYISSKVVQEATLMADLMKADRKQILDSYVRFKSGIPSLDNKIKWLYGGQYICIAGAPGQGKTTMGINIALNIPRSLIMSYEMSEEELHNIIVSRHANIDSEKLESESLEFGEEKIIESARRELSNSLTLRVCDKPLSLSGMIAFIKVNKIKHNIQCVVIDYAQIIPGLKDKGNQTEKFEDLSRRLKLLARELKITVIALSQLNKDSMREGRAPTLTDLRGSLSFGADADKVIFLYELPDDNTLGKGVTLCSVGKNRKGRIGKLENFNYVKHIHFMR